MEGSTLHRGFKSLSLRHTLPEQESLPLKTTYPFFVKDCTLAAIATGRRAQNLRELHDHLQGVHPGSIYYHFWGGLLRPRFDDPEYNNDFAVWAHQGLHDQVLAERLAVIDPACYTNLEDLRREVLEVIEERLDEVELIPWARADQQFHFMRSMIVVFDTRVRLEDPRELVHAVARMSPSSVFYHFIDARRRTPDNLDDFRTWLLGFGETYWDLCEALGNIDPYFTSLTELRQRLVHLFVSFFGGEEDL